MFYRKIFLVLFIILLGCQKKQKAPDNLQSFKGPFPDTISIMEYNVENLFDMVDNGMEYPEFKPGAFNWTLSTFQIKVDNIASVIAAINADVAVLTEVENENATKELLAALKKKKCYYPFYALGDKPNHTVTIPVILSRFPLFDIRSYGVSGQDAMVSRNLLEADVFLGRDTLKVFACHWPSKKEPESRRVAAAKILHTRLMQLPHKKQYVIAGDFNENYDECATFHTLGLDDSYGVTGINHILGTLRAQSGVFTDFVTKKNILDSSRLQHFDPWLDLPEDKRMSEIFQHQKNTLDHILLSPALFDSSGLSYVDSSFHAFTWDSRLLMKDAPFRWQMRYENNNKYHRGEGFSDHLPIVAKMCKGPFHYRAVPTKTDISKKEKSSIKTIGFETGLESFAPCAPYIRLSRDKNNALSGLYSLKISGLAKQNGCAAHAIISCALADDSLMHWYSMGVRGQGLLSLRMKIPKSGKWSYYNGLEFKPGKGAKYTQYDFPNWKQIKLPLPFEGNYVKEVEVEIRIKKDTMMEFWIDDILIQ
jgi:hypothetical protein